MKKTIGFILFVFVALLTQAQNWSSAEIYHEVQKLKNTSRVLYIAAHPDDENTRLISHLTHFAKCDVAYLSLTRGSGGQNLIGSELSETLGLIRTNELLEARSIDHATQYFSRALDFGYSKTPDETFEIWDKEKILSDVVWVIRNYQPDIIITRFSPEVNPDRGTHGHHTASARLALEAFDLAADETAYPEQLDYVKPWKTQNIYWNTSWWFYGDKELYKKILAKEPGAYTYLNVNQHSPLLNVTGSEVSSASRSQHKSQGFGSSPVLDEQPEYLKLLKSASDLKFDELTSRNWSSVMNGKAIDKALSKLLKKYHYTKPSEIVSALFDIRELIQNTPNSVLRKTKIEAINQIIVQALGLRMEVNTGTHFTFQGAELKGELQIYNPSDSEINIRKMVWNKNTLVQNQTVSKGGTKSNFALKLAQDQEVSQPYWLKYPVKNGYVNMSNLREIGSPMGDYAFETQMEMTVDGKEITLSLPILYHTTDPVKGSIHQPIIIRPDVMLNLGSTVYFLNMGTKQSVTVELISGKPNMSGYVELNLPDGWTSEPKFFKTELKNTGERKTFTFTISGPSKESEGRVRAIFKTNEAVYSQGYVQLEYDHINHWAYFPTADAKLVNARIETRGKQIAYLPGAGDKVPESLRILGYEVELLDPNKLPSALSPEDYDAVIVGIRAYNVNADIASFNNLLKDYIEKGGTGILQYNTRHRLKSKELGPLPITLSRDRVTNEKSAVNFLVPSHKVLNTPNRITQADFKGWVQERGLYFPSEWHEDFDAILGMQDDGESEKKGSLVVAKYGQGHMVYTGLSFFRELPAGVPGAYKIMANLIALGQEE
jgi:LmbE family N-acetylglucosaminyl deacetylase